jgi:hypothetical protein
MMSGITHVTLKETNGRVVAYMDTYPEHKMDTGCGLNYHGFIPFQPEESEYDSGSEDYQTDSDSDSDYDLNYHTV